MDFYSPNMFVPTPVSEIESFESETGRRLPGAYKDFISTVGWGRLTVDEKNVKTSEYTNVFLRPNSIREILEKRTFDWFVYPDFVEENEIPFFEAANQFVLVFREGAAPEDQVFYPGMPEVYADSFADFLEKLRNDVTFFMKILGQ